MTATANLDPDVQRRHDIRNWLHTVILVGGTALLAAAIAWVVYGPEGLVWAAIFGGAGLYVLGRVSPDVVLKLYKARELSPQDLPELHKLIRELTAGGGLPAVPRLHYVPSKMLNAFAVGQASNSAIAITDGLIRAMTIRQLAGILAHEISHVRNGDLRVMGCRGAAGLHLFAESQPLHHGQEGAGRELRPSRRSGEGQVNHS